jgi:hypothetical protein
VRYGKKPPNTPYSLLNIFMERVAAAPQCPISAPALHWPGTFPFLSTFLCVNRCFEKASLPRISLDRQPLYYSLPTAFALVRRPGGKVNTATGVGVLTEQSPNYQQKWIRHAEQA